MALCFNTPLPDLENELMQLILDGHIKARIDSINKVSFIVLVFQILMVKRRTGLYLRENPKLIVKIAIKFDVHSKCSI